MAKYDTDQIKSRYDLRDVVERDLGPPARRGTRDNRYACPFHNEQKGHSLAVYADHWHCYGKCSTGGDVITWTMRFHNLTFAEACQRLTGEAPAASRPASRPVDLARRPEPSGVTTDPPPEQWQQSARAVITDAYNRLWDRDGKPALRYLIEGRGLEPPTINHMHLGYVPGPHTAWRQLHGLNVPCGILIPWQAGGVLWGLKVRRAAGEPRYQQVAGGSLKGGLYLADGIRPGLPLLVTEGEFDAMVVWQVARDLVCPISIGSAGNARIDRRWWMQIAAAPLVLVRMDADNAGDQAAAHIHEIVGAARSVHVPQGKDINDFYLVAGRQAVRDWIRDLLA